MTIDGNAGPMGTGVLQHAFGYQGDNMALPVADVATAVPFYQAVLGFRVESRDEGVPPSATLTRDQVRIRLIENGGDPTQDGCAFHVTGIEMLFEEFQANGLARQPSDLDTEHHDGSAWEVFYVVAPDGLCYWFGERQPN